MAAPPSKRRKLEYDSELLGKDGTMEPFYPFRLVPSPQEGRSLETSKDPEISTDNSVEIWVTTTIAGPDMPALLGHIQKHLTPLDIEQGSELLHLKRVRRRERNEEGEWVVDVVLCAASTISEEDLKSVLEAANEQGITVTPRIEMVSRWPAYNRAQLAEFGKLWPVVLRKDSSRAINDPKGEALSMKGYMQQTISFLKLGKSEDLPIAAILVNPKTGQVLLKSHDTRISTKHPLNHSIMLLLRQLPSLLPSRMDSATITSDEEDTQYYANMYDVYISHEPCQMCCMALVHSRIRRLIFWKGMDTGARALGWMKGDETELLNHRYMCFEGIPGALPDDAEIEDLRSQVHV